MQHSHPAKPGHERGSWKAWLVLLGFLAIIGYLMTTEHRIHTLTVLPFVLLILACPLMMMFMHHGSTPSGGSNKS